MAEVGIQETKKLITELGIVIDGIDEIVEDGINFADVFRLLRLLSNSKDAINQFKKLQEIKTELQNLSPAEVMEIGQEFLVIIQKVLD